MFIKLLILSFVFVLIAMAFLGIRIMFKSNGRFPETHVGHNKEMRKRGLSCAQNTDIGCNPTNDNMGCASCGYRVQSK